MNMILASSFNPTYLFIAILLGLLIGMMLTNSKKVDKSKIQGLDLKDFMDTKRKGTLVDVRKEGLYKEGKIVGAKNLPGKSGAGSATVRKDIPVFLYDQNGKKAKSAAAAYVKDGCVMVYYLKGGYEAYVSEKEGNNAK